MKNQYTTTVNNKFYPALPHKHYKRSGFLRRLKLSIRRIFLYLLAHTINDETKPLPNLYTMKKILLVSVNQRLGNTILVTPAISALVTALPEAQFTFVGGRHAKSIMEGYAIKQVHTIRRIDTVLPYRLFHLVKTLRKEKYDATIHLSTATNSLGSYITYVSGAMHRIGCQRKIGNTLFTSVFTHPRSRHKVDQIIECVQQIGIPASGERRIIIKLKEQLIAKDFIRSHLGNYHKKPVGIFTGGRQRKGKAWDLQSFGVIANELRMRKIPIIVFIGPEEVKKEKDIQSVIGAALYIKNTPIRKVAALVAECKIILSPDSGTMHLAVAAGTKTVALFTKPNFDRWGPREPYGKVIFDKNKTNTDEVLNTLLEYYS